MGGVTFALQHPCFSSALSLLLLHLRFVLHISISAANSPPCITSSSASTIFVSGLVNSVGFQIKRPSRCSLVATLSQVPSSSPSYLV
ncbi:hypothetical protein K466DRAFT_201796 [Polyporus arcularius HHB13444]|uniref:Secreted protein n=1 Tax=Polyporus arcularius HHB13444 TaxID=1314778 RepID=A0A5C3P626_9APHY|nr:hypothetical protein K466DRAFT_201796 [Polyporus arcularius HHB13444]